MATVNLEEKLQKPVVCFTVFGDTHSGLLHSVDNNFNLVIDSREAKEVSFVRGETVLYIGFNDGNNASDDEGEDRGANCTSTGGREKRLRE